MKVFKSIGSKDRFVEVFQNVNKIRINEDVNANIDAFVNDILSQIKTKAISIKKSETQVVGDKSFVVLTGADANNNVAKLTFKVNADEDDQEGVFGISGVELREFSYRGADGSQSLDLNEDDLQTFNAQHGKDLYDIVGDYVDVKSTGIGAEEDDSLYEEAVKLIDKVPYLVGSEKMQTQKAYADEKPTNSAVRVNAPELNMFVAEDIDDEDDMFSMPPDYNENEPLDYDDEEDTQEPEVNNEPEEEVSEEKKKIIFQAYDNLIARNTPKNPNYSPTMNELVDEIEKMRGQKVEKKEKKRTFPIEAEPFLQKQDIVQFQYDKLTPEIKQKLIRAADEYLDFHLGVNKFSIPKEKYYGMIKQIAKQMFVANSVIQNESDEKEYPNQIGKEFKPKSHYPKKKKKIIKTVKLDEDINELPKDKRALILQAHYNLTRKRGRPEYTPTTAEIQGELNRMKSMNELATFRKADKVDINAHKMVLVHLWSGSLDGTKVAIFVPGTHKETGEKKWMLYPKQPIAFVKNEVLTRPDVAFLEGQAAKEFLRQQGYKIRQDNKTITKLEEVVERTEGENLVRKGYQLLMHRMDFNKLSSTYEDLLKTHSKFRDTSEFQGLLSSPRDAITKYFNMNNMQVSAEDVQNYYVNGLSRCAGVAEEEKEDDGMSLEPKGDEVEQLAQDKEQQGDVLRGGLGDDKSPLEFDPEQILLGIEVEKEHTNDPLVAIEIAMDHLSEDPEYYTRKDDPEASAQDGAARDAEEKEEAPEEKSDDEMADVLLGYEPKNVGEKFDYAAERNYEDKDAYNKYLQYQQKDFNMLSDSEKEEFFELWKEFKGIENVNEAPSKRVVVFDGTSAFVEDENNISDDVEVLERFDNIDDAQAFANKYNDSAYAITEQQVKLARQALNKRGIVEGLTKKEAVQILIKNNLKKIL